MRSEPSAIGLLIDRTFLHRLRHAVGRDVAAFDVAVEPDPELCSLLEPSFESVEDVRRRLTRLESALLDRDDRRAVFATVYAEMTEQAVRAIDADVFQNPAWMKRYLVRFAEYYRRAFLDYERGERSAVPDPWTVAFATAIEGNALVVQDAFLGINAHINYDLALTLSDVGIDPDRASKYADHDCVNDILRSLVAVQRELLAERYAPGLSRIGDGLGDLDELGATLGLRAGREKAWRVAVVRTDAGWLPVDRYTRWVIHRTATGTAHVLLAPHVPEATMRTLRAIEGDEFDLRSFAARFHERA
ncbi:DUF5995 family protein [Halovivax gelatinilyticus]|uniref:DUF5995 family protein n=1 Tax=Halovivax gelatinilyticus TaxID=2961597 RepID=UPI0020CA492C|nr:DUF5995 family protein [Halovivax gelatinilyticus]